MLVLAHNHAQKTLARLSGYRNSQFGADLATVAKQTGADLSDAKTIVLQKLTLDGDEQFGVTIVRRACEEPVRQIVVNCGTEAAVVVEKIRSRKEPNFGCNATTEVYEDLVKAGVIDPTKVTRTALQNAASIASLMLTTEAMICAAVEEAVD